MGVSENMHVLEAPLRVFTIVRTYNTGNIYIYTYTHRVRSSSVGIAKGWKAGIQIPAGENISLLHSFQIGVRAHPASGPMGTEGKFRRG
jgi:hypothetical protein